MHPEKTARLDPAYALILLAGAALRLYGLGTQSQWIDEMLSTLNASLSWQYILDLTWNIEVHPPGYYLFKHLQLLAGKGDVWLRLPSALCGILCIPLAYRLALVVWEDRRFGHVAMALTAFAPLHVWISRQSRPYGLIALAAMALALHLARAARGGSPVFRPHAVLCNFVLAGLHFSGLLFLAAQAASLALLKVRGLVRAGWADMARYVGASLLCAAPSAVFFLHARLVREDRWISNKPSLAESARKIGLVLRDYLFLGPQDAPPLWMFQGLLVLVGAYFAVRRGNRAGCLLASLFFCVFALLLLGGYAAHMTCVHVSFLLPASTCLAAYGLCRALDALGVGRFALAVPAVLLAAFLALDGRCFYAPDKSPADLYGPADRYGALAAFLGKFRAAGVITAFDDQTDAAAVRWYEALRNGGERVERNLSADDRDALLCYFAHAGQWARTDCCIVHKESGLEMPYLFQGRVGSLDLYFRQYRRDPRIVLTPGGPPFAVTANPESVLVRCLDFKDLSVVLEDAGRSPNGQTFHLSPAYAGVPGQCTFRLACQGQAPGGMLRLSADVALLREGNEAAVRCRVDGGPWTLLDRRDRVGGEPLAGAVALPGGTCTVDVRVDLLFGGLSAYTMYEPNTQVRFHGLTASLAPPPGAP